MENYPTDCEFGIAVGFAYHLGKTLKDWEDDKLTNENKSQLNLSFI